jgi:cob(I)alamin adenosyltransferase
MVKLNRIYTRTGDKGDTALGSGARVPKDSARIEAYGAVDEANAALGLALLSAQPPLDAMLKRIQNDLFDLGADLCLPEEGKERPRPPLRITDTQIERLEQEIDALNAELEPLTSFVMPSGTPAATALHLARTITRRAERRMVSLARTEFVSPPALRYVNRLSDFLFVAARYANKSAGQGDVLWVPGENR